MLQLLQRVHSIYTETFSRSDRIDRVFENYFHVIPITTVTLYLLMVFYLPKVLRGTNNNANAKPKERKVLKAIMVSWNFALSLMSIGLLVLCFVPWLYHLKNLGFWQMVCDTENVVFQPSPMIFFAKMFSLSKFPELVDTLLLIVKNPERPVPFLHYYHHATVLLFGWYGIYSEYTVSLMFGLVNATIHAFMYFYYGLTELGYRPTWAVFLTIAQIVQMVIGVILNVLWAKEYLSGKACRSLYPKGILVSAVVMYGSYLYLFVQFFIKRYYGGSTTGKAKSA